MTLNNSHKVNGNEMLICCTNAQINFFYLSSQPTKKIYEKVCRTTENYWKGQYDHKISRMCNLYLIKIHSLAKINSFLFKFLFPYFFFYF